MIAAFKGEQDGIWVQQMEIHSYEADFAGRLSLDGALKFFQECAWNHAEHLGVGYSHLLLRNQVWMLSRMSVLVDRYPEWGQSIIVRTWPRGAKTLWALRDFEILDLDGKRLIGATSGWLVYDLNARKPQRAELTVRTIRSFPDRRAIQFDPEKVEESIPTAASPIAVRYSDLDLNNHVNNTTYARWILDSYPVEFHRRHTVRSMTINFLAELGADDAAELCTAEIGSMRLRHTIRRRIDGAESCRAELLWQSADSTD
jgi:medium-chain acyl-[acyl-carrier-protein] hydrolase